MTIRKARRQERAKAPDSKLHAPPKMPRMRMSFSDTNWVKMGSFSFFEKVEIGEIVNV
jgi:hypothetical protein